MDVISNINEVVKKLLPDKLLIFDKPKYINDPILGSIIAKEYEQAIIDTPLFQRLRYIRQTGFTYLTFPTAQHTRFEHSLGVMTIAEKLFNVIKEKSNIGYINNDSLIRIRLASLLHDIGHSAFSHTSEEFYSHLNQINEIKSLNKNFTGKGAGEILSSLIINSEAFKSFFELLKENFEVLKSINISDVANLVIGKPISKEYGYEADIISGPIDADKLDYFPRDGRSVGLDVSLDIHRLINCVELQEITVLGVPRMSLVLNKRGYNSLQQLLFARATLTASVYHHHKVRACDVMLKNILSAYRENNIGFKRTIHTNVGLDLNELSNYLLITDNDVIYEQNNLEVEDLKFKLLNKLFKRDLFKRVLKISLQTVTTEKDISTDNEDIIKAELSQFRNLRNNYENKNIFINEVIAECKTLGLNISIYDMALDIPNNPNFEKAGEAAINISSTQNPQIVTLKEVIPISDWVKGYEAFFSHAYIFGPNEKEPRIIIAIATAIVLLREGNGRIFLALTREAISEDIRDEVLQKEVELGIPLFRSN